MFTIRTILVPTDFSDSAAAAYQFARALARDHGARLLLVHVKPAPAIVYGAGVVPPEPEDYEAQLAARLRSWQPVDPQVPTDYRVLEGDAAPELLDLAEQVKADLIVMGTHGRTGLTRLLMGSVAEQLVRRAPCPVLTLRLPVNVPELRQEQARYAEAAH